MLLHCALAESYILQGDFPRAINQLELALSSGDGDFYEISSAESRLKMLRRRLSFSRE